ncbi:hypothetical protein KJ570_02815 [Patescibacteria group bacterium]|nr:hypothetical protein [Patescibacteria group bacterium]MBU2036096.1 hypothetical protein [Patescibacteria group bacterium]
MINKSSVRLKNKEKFKECIRLRKQGLSYSEIRKIIPVAKSTLQNWLVLAGLTLTKEHIEIQIKKRLEKRQIATEASRIIRQRNKERIISQALDLHKKYFNDPFYNYGIALYESEGSKGTSCKFSNSDYRVILVFVKFMEKYFSCNRLQNMGFEIYVHETRKKDLKRIINFWSKKLNIPNKILKIYWKRNIVVRRRNNLDYVGQMLVKTKGEKLMGSKIQAVSDIILKKYQKR